MRRLARVILLFTSLAVCYSAKADIVTTPDSEIANYLLPNAPIFELTITQFRQQFTQLDPTTPLQAYHALPSTPVQRLVTIAATKITETLYSSTALEIGTAKIKSIQLTWLPTPDPQASASRQQALNYMVNLIHFFSPQDSLKQCQAHLQQLLESGREGAYTIFNAGSVRYILSYRGAQGITLAAEPMKLVLQKTN